MTKTMNVVRFACHIPLNYFLRSTNVVTQWTPPRRAKARRLPSPHRVSILFLFGGGNSFFWYGRWGSVRLPLKKEAAEFKCNTNSKLCLRLSYHIVSGLKEYTRGISLGNSARATSASSRYGNGSNTSKWAVPISSWGEDSPLPSALPRFVLLSVASRRAGQGSPHPAAQTPLRFFMSTFVVSLSLRTYELHTTQALVFSPDTLAEIPEGAMHSCLPQSFCDYTKTPPTRACTRESLPWLN